MPTSIESARELLLGDLQASEARISEIKTHLADEKASNRRLSQALRALASVDGKDGKPRGVTKETVRPLVEGLLRDNASLDYEALYDLVREKLSDSGASANGLGLRMKEVLSESWVREATPGVYSAEGVTS